MNRTDACFSRRDTTPSLNLEISGGRLRWSAEGWLVSCNALFSKPPEIAREFNDAESDFAEMLLLLTSLFIAKSAGAAEGDWCWRGGLSFGLGEAADWVCCTAAGGSTDSSSSSQSPY